MTDSLVSRRFQNTQDEVPVERVVAIDFVEGNSKERATQCFISIVEDECIINHKSEDKNIQRQVRH